MPKSSERQLIQERKEKAKKLAETFERAKQKLAELNEAKAYVLSAFHPGMEILHRAYGRGSISEISGKSLTVQFESRGSMSLGILMCVINGLITVEDDAFQERLNGYRTILRQDNQINNAYEMAEKAFLPYAEFLE